MSTFEIPTPITPIVEAIRLLYGTAKTINDFIDEQIDVMKSSAKEAVQVCGKILEGVKYGFGIGYATSIVAITIGHLLMGNPLQVVTTLTTGATGVAAFTNPIAMTCAAIGAIYYGWNALDEHEKETIIERVVNDFKSQGKTVLMIGDGINDAAALSAADLSIAMGTGTDSAIGSADITLMRPGLMGVVDALALATRTLRTIKVNLGWAFAYNAVGIPIAAMGLMSPMYAAGAMALSSLLVVTNSLRIK